MKQIGKIAGYVLLVTGVAAIIVAWMLRVEENDLRAGLPDQAIKPMAVETVRVTRGPVAEWIVGEGRVEAIRKRALQFEGSGKVVYLHQDEKGRSIREGSRVAGPVCEGDTGQLLARIDARDALADIRQSAADLAEARERKAAQRAELSKARNDLARAHLDFDRKKQLFTRSYLAESDLDQAKALFRNARDAVKSAEAEAAAAASRVQSARAELDKVERGQEKSALFAPFDGLVARINIKEGEYFDPDDVDHSSEARLLETAPMTIIDPSLMEATLYLPEYEGQSVKPGQPAVFVPGAVDWYRDVDAASARRIEGAVYAVSPQVDATRRAIRVKARFRQDDNVILDGMFVSCWIAVNAKQDALRIPLGCLQFQGGKPYVFVVEHGNAVKRGVKLGVMDETYAEALAGLEQGEIVVGKGGGKLSSGRPVRVVETTEKLEGVDEPES